MNTIFNSEFVIACRGKINAYNNDRGGFSKFFASGAFRKLSQLDALLEKASTAEHCAYILVYIYNEMSSHNTEKFYALAKELRSNIYEKIQANTEIPGKISGFVTEFKGALERQEAENLQNSNELQSAEEYRSYNHTGPSSEELRARKECIQAFIYALDVPTHNAMPEHTKVSADTTMQYSDGVKFPVECIVNPAPEIPKKSGCVVS